MADLVACTHGRSAYELWQLNVEKSRLIAGEESVCVGGGWGEVAADRG
jgi:hypothetical protein